MKYYDDFKDPRFKSAEAIGRHADSVFRAECHKRGLNPDIAIASPIAALVGSPICEVTAMNYEQILNLWYAGLTRPEIIALGATYAEFQNTIKKARAVGDSRAYYRNGSKSHLPWSVNITEPAKRRAKKHRMVSNPPGKPAHAILTSSNVGSQAMKKSAPPFTPKPKRATGDADPTFIGPFVDSLVSTFSDIDQAKRELDKRFVPKSDILRTEVQDNKD